MQHGAVGGADAGGVSWTGGCVCDVSQHEEILLGPDGS